MKLTNLLSQLPKPYLILGDFSSHPTRWGCRTSNDGRKVANAVSEDQELALLVSRAPTHFVLDLGTPDIRPIFEWPKLSNFYGSEHFPVLIHTPYKSHTAISQPKWNTNRAKCAKFRTHINESLDWIPKIDTMMKTEINIIVQEFTNVILEAMTSSIST